MAFFPALCYSYRMDGRTEISAEAKQREYYARTADAYDTSHCGGWSEHDTALTFLLGMMPMLGVSSVLDIGSGTGRALRRFKQRSPRTKVLGIEPSPELRLQGHASGLSPHELVDGDGNHLVFSDGAFDLVTEFGVLHHVPEPSRIVAEMLRVARMGIFISDCNNFGQGSSLSRIVKQAIRQAGLWPAFNFARTRGKKYMVSEEDGIYYSYSVFDNFRQVEQCCRTTYLLSTSGSGANLYRSASHVALLGIK